MANAGLSRCERQPLGPPAAARAEQDVPPGAYCPLGTSGSPGSNAGVGEVHGPQGWSAQRM